MQTLLVALIAKLVKLWIPKITFGLSICAKPEVALHKNDAVNNHVGL